MGFNSGFKGLSQTRTQNLSLEGEVADHGAIYNLCLVSRLCCKHVIITTKITRLAVALYYV